MPVRVLFWHAPKPLNEIYGLFRQASPLWRKPRGDDGLFLGSGEVPTLMLSISPHEILVLDPSFGIRGGTSFREFAPDGIVPWPDHFVAESVYWHVMLNP